MRSSGWQAPRRAFRPVWVVFCTALAASAPATPARAQSVWGLTPYRIRVLVAMASAPELTPQLEADLLAGLVDRTAALIGAPWDVTFTPAPPALGRAMTSAIETVAMESLPQGSLDYGKQDKVMLLAVTADLDRHQVTVREFDVRTRRFSAVVSRPVWQLGKLRDVALGAMLKAFAPLGRIERVEKKLRIQVLLAVAREAKLEATLRDKLLAHLAEQVKPLAEDDRDVTVTSAPAKLRDALGSSSEALSAESFPRDSLGYDEVILLFIAPAEGGYQVITLRLTPLSRVFTGPKSRPLPRLEGLRHAAGSALSEAIAGIKRPRKTWVTLRLKAGALPPRDKELAMVEHGDAFLAVIRYNDREGNPRRIMAIPWTFCTAEQFAAGQLVCRVHTGLRSPLSGRRRGRVQPLALAVVPPQRPSLLILQSRSDPPRPLAGYDVYARAPDSKTSVPLGRTDRQGHLTVPPLDAENPLQMLLVRHGGEPLTRWLPMVPGMEPVLTAPIANDDQRLAAEGFITGLQEEMVDLVTRREVLLTRIRARIDDGKLDQAQKLLEKLRKLPTAAEFALMLKEQRKKVRSVDATVQAKINALFADTRKLLQKHLDPRAVDEIWQELRTAQADTGS